MSEQHEHSPRAEPWHEIETTRWDDWRWQLKSRVRSLSGLESWMTLTEDEKNCVEGAAEIFPVAVTPYYASLMSPDDPSCPIRRQSLPLSGELEVLSDETDDPLAEEQYMPVPGITHRYPDRVLLYTTHNCPVYCRHCNRRRKVGDPSSAPSREQLQIGIDYIAKTPAVRDVLVSGGDPLSFTDERLDWLLGELRKIEHLEIIRIATRNPVTLPQRITESLVEVLSKHHPIYISTHFNHLKECTPEAARGLERLANAGCAINNQMVLLKDINDDPEMVRDMNRWLLKHRCRPYYIFQCDSVEGVGHFKTPVSAGVELIDKIRGWTSGLAVPHYVVDLPSGGGKVPLQPGYLLEHNGKTLRFRNYAGEIYEYVEGEDEAP